MRYRWLENAFWGAEGADIKQIKQYPALLKLVFGALCPEEIRISSVATWPCTSGLVSAVPRKRTCTTCACSPSREGRHNAFRYVDTLEGDSLVR